MKYQISDLIVPADNFLAREITTKFFSRIEEKIISNGWRRQDLWIFNDVFFSGIALPWTQLYFFLKAIPPGASVKIFGDKNIYSELIALWCEFFKIEYESHFENKSIRQNIKSLGVDILLVLYSLFSALIAIFMRPQVVIWTGDFSTKKGGVRDPRWGMLFEKLDINNIRYAEMVRTTGQSFKNIFSNLIKRNFGVFYYQSFWNLFSFFLQRKVFKKNKLNQDENDFFVMVFDRYYPMIQSLRWIEKVAEIYFRILKPRVVYSFCITSRSSPIVWGAQKAGINTVGIMHGISSKSYMGHEYLFGYRGLPIGNNYYGVWSQYWLNEFCEHSKLFSPKSIQVSGPQKDIKKRAEFKPISNSIHKILIISEQELDVEEFMPYFSLLREQNFALTLKIRPFGVDKFYAKLKKSFPDIKLDVSNENLEDVINNYDLVIGSHSTAVLEATLFGKPFLLFKSKKWGDVFGFENYLPSFKIYNHNPIELINCINALPLQSNIHQSYMAIQRNFFGESHGADWLLKFAQGKM